MMAVTPFHRDEATLRSGSFYLTGFQQAWAPLVASWVDNARDLFWLAPKTHPPLTAEKVLAWPQPTGQALLFWHDDHREPAGYAELNAMAGQQHYLWIGHCLIRPDRRGLGWGRKIVELLLEDAFIQKRASMVSLVVFPENTQAVRCYRSAGFRHVREQVRYLPAARRHYCMVEMRITRRRYLQR
jgi:ribosomal protein S18 acetylase RimI-like enzyme